MVGVSVACSSIELVPSVIEPTVPWWIQMVGCQCSLFLYRAGADCNKTYCTVVDTDGGCQCRLFLYRAGSNCNKTYCTVADTDSVVSVSPVPLLS